MIRSAGGKLMRTLIVLASAGPADRGRRARPLAQRVRRASWLVPLVVFLCVDRPHPGGRRQGRGAAPFIYAIF